MIYNQEDIKEMEEIKEVLWMPNLLVYYHAEVERHQIEYCTRVLRYAYM